MTEEADKPAFGCEPDVEDPLQPGVEGLNRDRDIEEHIDSPLSGATGHPPVESSLQVFWPQNVYQGADPSCVGHAVAAGIQVAHRAAGHSTAPLPSRMWIWNCSRHRHQSLSLPLQVTGTYLREAIKHVQKSGYPTDKDWPYDPDARETMDGKVIERRQARPPLSVVRRAFDHRGPKGYYRAFGVGSIQRAIGLRSLPVVVGMLLDDEFLDPKGPVQVDRIVPTRGLGHAMTIIGYLRIGGTLYFETLNWWRGWRESLFLLRAELVEEAYDIWVIDP